MSIMKIAATTMRLRVPEIKTLDEKQILVNRLIEKVQSHHPVSAAEIDEQMIPHIIVIGFAAIVPDNETAHSLMDDIFRLVHETVDTSSEEVEQEILEAESEWSVKKAMFYTADDGAEAKAIIALLKENAIPAYCQGFESGEYGSGIYGVDIYVDDENLEKAKECLKHNF